VDDEWVVLELVNAVSSELDDGWPFITQDMKELWFTRTNGSPGIFRSLRVDGVWGNPELVLSPLAGEPSLDAAGNLYFAHHRWDEANALLGKRIFMFVITNIEAMSKPMDFEEAQGGEWINSGSK
jgi:hypothetical protein